MFCFNFFLILVSYQSLCSNLYAIGRNRLHEDPRSNCSASGDLTWFCSCFPVVHRRFSFVSERRCGVVRSDCHHCSSFGQPIDRRGSSGGGRGGPAGREKLWENKFKKKKMYSKLIDSTMDFQSQPKRKIRKIGR